MSNEKSIAKHNLMFVFSAIGFFTLCAIIFGIINGDSIIGIALSVILLSGIIILLVNAQKTSEVAFDKLADLQAGRYKEEKLIFEEYNIKIPLKWFL